MSGTVERHVTLGICLVRHHTSHVESDAGAELLITLIASA